MNRRYAAAQQARIGQERWLVSYADFITLLFGFFVVLYSVSQLNENKYKKLSDTLAQAFHSQSSVEGSSRHTEQNLVNIPSVDNELAKMPLENPQRFAEQLNKNLANWVNEHQARIEAGGDWVEIDLNANWVFASGSDKPNDKAQPLLQALAAELSPMDADISVFGHTDNQPINTAQFANNWALSAARAVAVVNMLAGAEIAPNRLSAVGYGEFRPLTANDTDEGRARNRRVVLRLTKTVANSAVLQKSEQAELTEKSATPEAISLQDTPRSSALEPVLLKDGGLLFTSDPKALSR